MVEIITKNAVHRIINKVKIKVVIEVVVQIEVGEKESSLTIITSNVTIAKNMATLLMNTLQIRIIKKMIQSLQSKMMRMFC